VVSLANDRLGRPHSDGSAHLGQCRRSPLAGAIQHARLHNRDPLHGFSGSLAVVPRYAWHPRTIDGSVELSPAGTSRERENVVGLPADAGIVSGS